MQPPIASRVQPPPAVLAAWFSAPPQRVEPLGTSGFSGVYVGLVEAGGGRFVIKSFAAGTTLERAAWVHGLAATAARAGMSEVPVPRAARSGGTCVADRTGGLWEVVPFVEGHPVDEPSAARIAAASAVLARFHRATAAWSPAEVADSPGVVRRLTTLTALAARPWSALRGQAAGPLATRIDQACDVFSDCGGAEVVASALGLSASPLPLQPVLRDVWSAHVLFDPAAVARVSGIVDLHAAGVDTPATDCARLLGSWLGPQRILGDATWEPALAAYRGGGGEAIPAGLVTFLHAAGVVCGLDNWFRWVIEERRRFPAPEAVLARVDRLLGQLPAALAALADPPLEAGLTRGKRSL